MTNAEYIEKIIQFPIQIFIDTATLMESKRFRIFIENNYERFMQANQRIVVPVCVYSELLRHLKSDKLEKRTAAADAFSVFEEYRDLFEIQAANLTEEEINRTFADASLLSELILGKSEQDQLLITNDKNLSTDAFGLNMQQSCRGHRIKVCYLNTFGELHRCECAKPHMRQDSANSIPDTPSSHVSQSNPTQADSSESPHSCPSTSTKDFGWMELTAGIGIGAIAVSIVEILMQYTSNKK